MTRGNQREMARAKNLAKHADTKGKRADGKDFKSAKESDADIMRKKQEAAAEKKAAKDAEGGSGGGKVQVQKLGTKNNNNY